MQNDLLDLYPDEISGGKSGTDIQEGKYTLLALTALKLSNESQKKTFLENYGRWEEKCVDQIRTLYNELQLQDICSYEETKLYKSICQKINTLPENSIPPGHFFMKLVNEINKVKNINYNVKT